ncbi:hypothetical protein ES332_A06G208600v1 [Gossypium tomentosum]|uniref:Uncharacterized protein n=1 Tax=Gossypium tomentosum TaxID=34277 RepID=A0A5D2Q9B9_GOSTO|nr:hypothetical protein ES332_A06G208600v1 [Gossypium tomentosum]
MEITNKNQRIQTPLQFITTSHLLKLVIKILLPFSLLSCRQELHVFALQWLLVFIATSSGLIDSCSVETDIKAEKGVKMSKGGSQTELGVESSKAEPKGVPLVVELEDEDDRSNEVVSIQEDEDDLKSLSNEELNKKCEDFIRKMKQVIHFDTIIRTRI